MSGLPESHEAIDSYNQLNMAYQGRNPSRQLAAMHITAESHEWLTDSGATHHVINDASHLQYNSNYGGNDRCMGGGGSGLRICGVGSTLLATPSSVKLNNIHHVPDISRTLLSVDSLPRIIIATLNFTFWL